MEQQIDDLSTKYKQLIEDCTIYKKKNNTLWRRVEWLENECEEYLEEIDLLKEEKACIEETKHTRNSTGIPPQRISRTDFSPSQVKLFERLLTENEVLKTKLEISEEENDILARQIEGADIDNIPITDDSLTRETPSYIETKYKFRTHQISVAVEVGQKNNKELDPSPQPNGRHYQELFAEIFAKLKAMRDSSL